MKTRNWIRFFLSTLLIGGISGLIFGLVIKWGEFAVHLSSTNIKGMATILLWFIGTGLMFSAVSQMAFFAYLTIHQFGLGMFRSVKLWNSVQILLMLFVIGDILIFRTISGKENGSFFFDLSWILLTIFIGVVVATKKSRETKKEAFIPALFFMVFVTIIEMLPVISVGDQSWLLLSLLILLVCNAYQMLILHRITTNKASSTLKSA
ncbi:MAG: KinB-signaling pathway activation protein [Bacillaceae bacterium]